MHILNPAYTKTAAYPNISKYVYLEITL